MHTLFLLLVLLLAAVVGGAGVLLLRLVPVRSRRPLALLVLVAPLFMLAMGVFHIVPHFWPECAPLVGWDRVASFGLLLAIGSVVVGALGLNMVRLALVERLLLACPPLVEQALASRMAGLSLHMGIATPAVRLLRADAPLAVTGGLWRPTVVLSHWLVEELDHRELEAVLAHELAHVARRDYLTRWFGRLLRDALVWLPSSWYALRMLEADEELAADALAVEATGRPLSMASALGKVWRSSASAPRPLGVAGLPGYAGEFALLEERLSHLLNNGALRPSPLFGRLLAGASLILVGGFAPQLLAVAASTLLLVCNLRPFWLI